MCRPKEVEEIKETTEAFDLYNHLFDDISNDDSSSSISIDDDGPVLTPSEDEEEEREWEKVMLLPLKHEVFQMFICDKVSKDSLEKASAALDNVIPMNILKIKNVEILTTLIANRNDHVDKELEKVHKDIDNEIKIWSCNEEMKEEQNKRRIEGKKSLKTVIDERIATFEQLIIEELLPLMKEDNSMVHNPVFTALWNMFRLVNYELNIRAERDYKMFGLSELND